MTERTDGLTDEQVAAWQRMQAEQQAPAPTEPQGTPPQVPGPPTQTDEPPANHAPQQPSEQSQPRAASTARPDPRDARIRELEQQLTQQRQQSALPGHMRSTDAKQAPRMVIVGNGDTWDSIVNKLNDDDEFSDLHDQDVHGLLLAWNAIDMDTEAHARGFGGALYQFPVRAEDGTTTTRVGYHVFEGQRLFLPPKQS